MTILHTSIFRCDTGSIFPCQADEKSNRVLLISILSHQKSILFWKDYIFIFVSKCINFAWNINLLSTQLFLIFSFFIFLYFFAPRDKFGKGMYILYLHQQCLTGSGSHWSSYRRLRRAVRCTLNGHGPLLQRLDVSATWPKQIWMETKCIRFS